MSYWKLSIGEVVELIEIKEEKELEELKEKLVLQDLQAKMTAEYIMGNPIPLSKRFPELFPEEDEEINNNQEMTPQLELNKARMEEFAFWHNQRRKKVE